MSNPIYKPLPNGYNTGRIGRYEIQIGLETGRLIVYNVNQNRKAWAIDLPENLQLCEAVEAPKADWSQAPEWAMWWAVDADGRAYWHESEPYVGPLGFVWLSSAQSLTFVIIDIPIGIDWRTLIEKRPTEALGL